MKTSQGSANTGAEFLLGLVDQKQLACKVCQIPLVVPLSSGIEEAMCHSCARLKHFAERIEAAIEKLIWTLGKE